MSCANQRRSAKAEEVAVVWANEWKLPEQYRLREALKGARFYGPFHVCVQLSNTRFTPV